MGTSSKGFNHIFIYMGIALFMGSVNMLLLKFQHMQKVPMGPGLPPAHFDHPWLQAGLMMVGELLCLPVYLLTRTPADAVASERVPKYIFLVPCCCDLVATALLCMGLALIAVSVAQMCRGTIVIFVCAMSVIFLGRRQHGFHLVGVALVVVGIVLVALSTFFDPTSGTVSSSTETIITGISLVVGAQVFQASMFVYEEKIMSQYIVQPLQVVGMEGLFGVIISLVLLSILHVFGVENTPGAFYQMRQSPALAISIFASMLAVAVFNFSGATVTQKSSAVARTTIKISSTILIWVVELTLGWNKFSYFQLFGFILVACGTLLYNRIVIVNFLEPPEESLAEELAINSLKGSAASSPAEKKKILNP
eukprot:gnl/TRDRNA2_/TRDRNA2_176967_c1_seq3.p1 gnl/TRDRNA2_/TRDRNA2_176967_c1~~gnl/TRDRNA2_/TRDRNA2_176967_c1_seq3.p1  ORF type:complete len:365 (+),score=55.30 gnl/TRDRNA2_/TRDRNA2_176967_c1_seq3:64-1158(+)